MVSQTLGVLSHPRLKVWFFCLFALKLGLSGAVSAESLDPNIQTSSFGAVHNGSNPSQPSTSVTNLFSPDFCQEANNRLAATGPVNDCKGIVPRDGNLQDLCGLSGGKLVSRPVNYSPNTVPSTNPMSQIGNFKSVQGPSAYYTYVEVCVCEDLIGKQSDFDPKSQYCRNGKVESGKLASALYQMNYWEKRLNGGPPKDCGELLQCLSSLPYCYTEYCLFGYCCQQFAEDTCDNAIAFCGAKAAHGLGFGCSLRDVKDGKTAQTYTSWAHQITLVDLGDGNYCLVDGERLKYNRAALGEPLPSEVNTGGIRLDPVGVKLPASIPNRIELGKVLNDGGDLKNILTQQYPRYGACMKGDYKFFIKRSSGALREPEGELKIKEWNNGILVDGCQAENFCCECVFSGARNSEGVPQSLIIPNEEFGTPCPSLCADRFPESIGGTDIACPYGAFSGATLK